MQPLDDAVDGPEPKPSRSGTYRAVTPSQLAEAQERLGLKYRTYYQLFEAAPIAYLVTDTKGIITHANRQASVLFNAGNGFLVGKTLVSLIARGDRSRLRDLIEVMSEVILRTELRIQPRAEDVAWVALSAQRGAAHAGGACIRWLLWNVRTQKQEEERRDAAEGHLQARIHDLEIAARRTGHFLHREQQARKEAEEGLRQKSRVLAEVAHEIGGQLGSLRGWLQLMSEGPLEARAQQLAIASMTRNAQDVFALLQDLMDHTRVELHQPMLTIAPIDLTRIVTEVMDELRPRAKDKGVSVELATEVYSIPMQGDALRLRQVFRNVLGNAIKFTPAQGHVRVEVAAHAEHVAVTFTDTGCGIDPERVASIFAPFAQLHTPAARRSGLGLGLSIARRLVELHGGTIEARSEGVGRGAQLSVRLPRIAPSVPPDSC